jgi:uncharacterized membrane protein YbhN (UPF0104 family)
MLHTLKERGDGVVPAEPWTPSVRRPMLRGLSADALSTLVAFSWLATVLSVFLLLIVVTVSHEKVTPTWGWIFLGAYVALALTTGGIAIASTFKTRREYRHGYTTLQSFSRYGYYYRTVAQLDPRTGVQVRAAGEPKIAVSVLKERCAAARAQQSRPTRMSRHEAAEAARAARVADEVNHRAAKAKSVRSRLVQQFGPEAGNLGAEASRCVLVAIIGSCMSFPLLLFGIEVTYLSRNPFWLSPFVLVAGAITALFAIAKRKNAKARCLGAQFLNIPATELPKGTLTNALGIGKYR